MVYYTDSQVRTLLEEILMQIPNNDNKSLKVAKFIRNKIENIEKHI